MFTYIRVVRSIYSLHVLPYYVPDKLLAREIAYQITGEGGLTKGLKEQKKSIWPAFPLQCGSFALHAYGYVAKEAEIIMSLKSIIVPRRQYDPNKIAKEFNTMVKVKQFSHEEDAFNDLFQGEKNFAQVLHSTSLQVSSKDINYFHVYRNKTPLKVPLDLLQIEPIR